MHTILLLSISAALSSPECTKPTARAEAVEWTIWGGDVRNTRFQSSSINARNASRLTLAWSYPLGDVANARSQPATFGGRLFVGSENGTVHAVDATEGCNLWTFKADMPVRTGIVASPKTRMIFFGDVAANVYGVDAATGKRLWKSHVDAHPAAVVTGTPQLFDGVLYVPVSSYESAMPLDPKYECCTFRGSVVALEAATGKQLWKTYTIDESSAPTENSKSGAQMRGPSGAAVWSTPTIDERLDRIYVATGNNYSDPTTARSDAVVALDRRTGAIVWSTQFTARDAYNSSCDIPGKVNCPASDGPDADFGQPPILVALPNGRRALVVGQKSGDAHALDPDRSGAVLWTAKVGPGGKLGGIHWGSAADARRMYVALGGQQMRVVPDSTIKEGYRIDPDPTKGGGLFALDLADGKIVWSAAAPVCGSKPRCSPAQSAAVTATSDLVFSGAVDGHVRAYSAATGEVLWDFDTSRNFGNARGGAIDVAGPVVVGRMVYVVSGYALWGGVPGNVLLAFRVE